MQFYNPNILYGLIAVVIPLIIHLFNFKRFKKVYFSNLSFLKDVQQQSKRHSQWRHLIIMALRMLAIIAVVLAFAGPFIPNDDVKAKKSDISFVNIFLDNSFSMEARGTEGSLFEQGRVMALDLAQSYKPTDKFRLINNNPFSFSRPFVSRKVFIDELDKISIEKFKTNLQSISEKIRTDKSESKYQELFIISDFQKKQINFAEFKSDSLINTILLPMIAVQQQNIFVDSLWIESPVLQSGQNVEIEFEISNQSDNEVVDLPVSLYIGGKKKSVISVNIDPFTTEKASFSIRMDSVGFYNGRINIQDYPVVYDDDFYFSFEVQKAFDVLCISSQFANKDLHALLKLDSTFKTNFIDQKAIDYADFPNYSTIILNSLTEYPSGLLSELKQFVDNGKSILILPHSKNSIDDINSAYRYFGLPLVNSKDSIKSKIQSLDLQSVEFGDIFELGKGKNKLSENTDLPYFNAIYLADKNRSGSISILIINEAKQPILLRKTDNGANIYAFYSSIEYGNSNLSSHAVFVPIMYNLIRNTGNTSKLFTFLGSDKEFAANISTNYVSNKILMKHYYDSTEFIPQYRYSQSKLMLSFAQNPSNAGNYQLMIDGKQEDVFSFNFNRDESYLNYYSINEIKGFIKDYQLENIKILNSVNTNISEEISMVNSGKPLWKLFVILVLMFLIFEVILLRFSK